MRHKYLIILLLELNCCFLFSQDLGQLSLDDLKTPENLNNLEIEVSTASKTLEGLENAPGVISVITSSEIEKFGANNILEIIERVASTYPTGSFYLPQNYVSIRGDLNAEYNNHVLILINGRPSRENLLGGIDFPLFFSLPIELIDRIEVVRGPGSVLYGSNAYTGLVNIITKEIKEDYTNVSAGYGSFDTFSFKFTNSTVKDDFKLKSGITYFNQKGWEWENIGEDIPIPGTDIIIGGDTLTQPASQNNIGGMVSMQYKNFTYSALIAFSGMAHHGAVPYGSYPGPFTFTQNRNIESVRTFMDAGYNFNISDDLKITLNGTYNSQFTRFKTPAGDAVIETKDVILEPTLFYSKEKVDFLFGATANLQEGSAETGDDLNRGVAFYSELWYRAYSQIKYAPSDFISLVAGAQINKPAGIKADFVPRFGAIITPFKNKGSGIKILYGQAFRAPFEAEQNLYDIPIIIGGEDLGPEKVSTFDFQLFYNTEKTYLAATYFHSAQKDLINRTVRDAPINEPGFPDIIPISSFANQNKMVLNGIEFEGKIIPSENSFLRASVTYQTNELNDTLQHASLAPELLIKLGGSFSTNNGVSLGVFNSYFSAAGKASTADERNPEAKSFHSLTANLNIDFFKLFKKENKDLAFSLNIYGVNLLDNDIRYPEYVRRQINTIPGRGGRAIYTSFLFKF